MSEYSVVILGVKVSEDDILHEILEDRDVQDALYLLDIETFGLDDNFWALGEIISDCENDGNYVQELTPNMIDVSKEDKMRVFEKIVNSINGLPLKIEDIKVFHTARVY